MPGDRVSWVPTPTNYPEGTAAFSHYRVHLGAMISPDLPAGTTMHEFPLLPPGDYPSSVDTVAADGTVLATHAGPVYHVPTPVMVPVAMGVTVERVP
jgi:hypothetical protein